MLEATSTEKAKELEVMKKNLVDIVAEKIAAFAAPYFQPTVGIAAAAAFVVGVLLGGLLF